MLYVCSDKRRKKAADGACAAVHLFFAGAEEEKRKFDFVVSRAVMPLGDLIKIIRKNIRQEQHNALPNGLICLKGGELEQETMPVKHKTMLYDLKDEFTEDFFKTKKVVYVTING